MKSIRLSIITLLFCGMATATFATTYYWDHSQSAHWARSKNWNSGGAGGFPNATSADAWLVYNNYPNAGGQGVGSGNMDVTVDDNDSSADTFDVRDLLVGANASNHDWTFDDGSTAGKIIVYEDMIFDLTSGGSATFNVEIELGDNAVDLHGKGAKAVLNGKFIGGISSVLDGTKAYYPAGQTSLTGGGLKLTASNNDGFLGTIKTGLQKVEITQINGLRNATIEISNVANSFIFPNNALIGALGGTYSLRLDNNLKVGNNNKATTYGGQFSQSGTLTKEGSATWTLSGASTHTGQTTINGGTIKIANANALQSSPVWLNVNNGLNVNGYNATIGGLGGAGNLNIGSTTLTIGGSGDYLHLGVISGSGIVKINMSGSQDFGVNNSYSGGTHLLSGTLKCNTAGDLGATSGALTLGNATFQATATHTQARPLLFPFDETLGTLSVDSGKTLTWSGLINDPSNLQSITKTGPGALAFSNDSNTYFGNIIINAGSVAPSATSLASARMVINTDNGLDISSGTTTVGSLNGSGSLLLNNHLTIGNHASSATYSGALSQLGAKTLTKISGGTQTFSGTSTRNGPTVVNGGTLVLNNPTSTPLGTGHITVNSGATLSGNGMVGSSVTVNSGGMITANSSAASLSLRGATIAGTFICSIDGSNATRLDSLFGLILTNGTLDLNFPGGVPTQAAYILLTYETTLTGTFASVLDLPAGYKIDYAYNGNSVALVEDNTAPTLDSITLDSSLNDPTSTNTVIFDLTFSENVTGVGMNDLLATFSGSGNSIGTGIVTGSGNTRVVTIPDVSGNGTFSLSLRGGAWIFDEANNRIDRTVLASASVEIDQTAPTVAITTPVSSPTNANSIIYNLVFSEPVSGLVDYTDFYITGTTVAGTDIAASAVVDSGGGTNFTIMLNNISGDGWLQFRLKANQIADSAGNNLASDPFSPGRTIDNTAPVLTLNGDASTTLDFGAAWSDPGATADDGSSVVIGGDTVNTSVPSINALTYDATDTAGNIATQLTRAVTIRTAYLSWALGNGLTEGVNDGLTDNPDGDNWNNRAEYALNGDPISSSNNWKVVGGLADVNGTNYLTRTFPVLDGTSFSGALTQTGINSELAYVVAGYTNLIINLPQEVIELSPALTNGMPMLDSGWNYHSFRLNESTDQNSAAFLKLKIRASVP